MTRLPAPADLVDRGHRRRRRLARTILLVVGAGLVAAALAAFVSGWRGFVVATPSMGTAAPVGTLVVTAPTTVEHLNPGDIVTFRPAPGGPTYTHRVVATTSEGVETRGDLNAVADPWRITQDELVGRSVAIIPVLGWAVRALPWLVVGLVATTLLCRRIIDPVTRAGVRAVATAAVVSAVCLSLRPFVGFATTATGIDTTGMQVSLVSTGILPITVTAPGAEPTARMHAGQVQTLTIGSVDSGHVPLTGHLDLDLVQWALLALICLGPLLWFLAAGFPDAKGRLR